MAIVQQSMEMDMWEIKEKLAERREQMAIRAYEEDKRREEWIQKIEEDKRREEWNQKIEEVINLIQSFIRNPISPVKTPQPVTTKSRVVIEVGQIEALDGGLNCDSRLANYEQPCQHFLMFDYDPQEGELQVKTWCPGKILEQHLEDKETDIQEKEQKESQRQTNPSTEWKGQSQKSSK
ncbi:hypothetical protein Tco_0793898 [Tanacetum coccineum]